MLDQVTFAPGQIGRASQRPGLMLLLCLFGIFLMMGVSTIWVTSQPQYTIGEGVRYHVADDQHRSLAQVLVSPLENWQVETQQKVSLGLVAEPFWFRFAVPDNLALQQRVLEIDYALLDDVRIWFVENGRIVAKYHAGDTLAFYKRPIDYQKLVFNVPEIRKNLEVVMRVETTGALRLPLRIWKKDRFIVFAAEHSIVMGLFFGFIAAMMFCNLFFYVTTRSGKFISYCGYVIFLSLAIAALHGVGYKYLWPESPFIQARALAFFCYAALLCAFIFSIQLLEIRKYSHNLHRIVALGSGVLALLVISSVALSNYWNIRILLPTIAIATLLINGVGIYIWWKGARIARFYVLAWSALWGSVLLASLENADILSLPVSSHYLVMLGATLETFLLALALALSYSDQRNALVNSQSRALQKEREARTAQEQLLKIRDEAREELEYKVQERTLELEIAMRELSEINQELERMNTLDPLTGIRNRRYFDKKLLAEVRRSRREQTPLSLVIIDIDHFKRVNDEHGHAVGDVCIKYVAQMIRQQVKRPADIVCRFGGEEFALILPATELQGATQLAAAIRQQLEQAPVDTEAGNISLTVSAGISCGVMVNEADQKTLFEQADKQLYKAKGHGRNQVCAQAMG